MRRRGATWARCARTVRHPQAWHRPDWMSLRNHPAPRAWIQYRPGRQTPKSNLARHRQQAAKGPWARYEDKPKGCRLHIWQESCRNIQRLATRVAPDVALMWYSGGSAAEGQASLSDSHSVCAVAAEGMYSPGPSDNFATVQHSPRDEVFVSRVQRNAPPIDIQGIASLHYDHVFVEVVRMLTGWRCSIAGPMRHLAPINSVENVALDAGGRLISGGDPVCSMLHELGEIIHGHLLSHAFRRRLAAGRWIKPSARTSTDMDIVPGLWAYFAHISILNTTYHGNRKRLRRPLFP